MVLSNAWIHVLLRYVETLLGKWQDSAGGGRARRNGVRTAQGIRDPLPDGRGPDDPATGSPASSNDSGPASARPALDDLLAELDSLRQQVEPEHPGLAGHLVDEALDVDSIAGAMLGADAGAE